LAVAGFEWVTNEQLFLHLLRAPQAVRAGAPFVGLALAVLILRTVGHDATSATADEYIRNYHDRHHRLDERQVPARILAGVVTLGLGGALGYEGPSVYLGASVGSMLQRRLARWFSRDDAKLLLVAGAAAGIAAIFKAPATGAVFALEVPFQDDTARRMLLPALTGSAAGYLVFVSLLGTRPLLPVSGAPPFDLHDLGGAIVVGLLAGIGARAFVAALRQAKATQDTVPLAARVLAAGAVLAGLALLSQHLFGQDLTLGPGYRTVAWATDPSHGLALVLGLLVMRAVATTTTLFGGGVGGLFIPLVIEGALLGRAVGGLFGDPGASLFPVIGIAAFLGAGYRTPLAAVMFVAESTGRPGFVVPGLIAAAVSQLVMGKASVSAYQRAPQAGHLERRFALPLTTAVETDVLTAPPDTTITEFVWHHLLATRQKSVPVVDGSRYLGMARMEELRTVPQDRWDTTPIAAVMRIDVPVAEVGWHLRDAVLAMERADIDRLPVVDAEGCFAGVVSTSEILKLDEILSEAEEE